MAVVGVSNEASFPFRQIGQTWALDDHHFALLTHHTLNLPRRKIACTHAMQHFI